MLTSLPVIIVVASVLGFLTGLGIGGGSLLILWLTMVLDMEPETARSINLLFFLPSAAISILFRHKQGNVCWKTALPAMAAGCLTAVLLSWLSRNWDTELLKKWFGLLLLATGTRELFYRRKSRDN